MKAYLGVALPSELVSFRFWRTYFLVSFILITSLPLPLLSSLSLYSLRPFNPSSYQTLAIHISAPSKCHVQQPHPHPPKSPAQSPPRPPSHGSSVSTAVALTPRSSKRNRALSSGIYNTPSASSGPTRPSSATRTRTSSTSTALTHRFGAGYAGFPSTLKSMPRVVLRRLGMRFGLRWRTMIVPGVAGSGLD